MASPEERTDDDLARTAAKVCGTRTALVYLVDGSRRGLQSRAGLQAKEALRELAFCAHAIQTPDKVTVVKDAQADPRLVNNALVKGNPNIRPSTGVPLVASSSEALGTQCAIDTVPRDMAPRPLAELECLASQAIAALERPPACAGVVRRAAARVVCVRRTRLDERVLSGRVCHTAPCIQAKAFTERPRTVGRDHQRSRPRCSVPPTLLKAMGADH